jgi:cytochrome d ubiquinol oxidase subunit II
MLANIFNYEIMRILWWVLLGVLFIGFSVTGGFDLGSLIISPFVGKSDIERRVVLNAMGPVWDGNQVWLITGAGAMFAAWPMLYAVSFSCFYLPICLILLALIIRPAALEFRSKFSSPLWLFFIDYVALFFCGVVASFLFGVTVGNFIKGASFDIDKLLVISDHTKLSDFFTLFTVVCGLISTLCYTIHGAIYISIKTDGDIQARCNKIARILPFVTVVLILIAVYYVAFRIDGYAISGEINKNAASNPLNKEVYREAKFWMHNYNNHKWLFLFPILSVLSFLGSSYLVHVKKVGIAFISSSLAMGTLIASVGGAMFPFILPSSYNPSVSLIVWDSSSSYKTLVLMAVAAILFVPVILAYTSWVYYMLRGKVTASQITKDAKTSY